METQCELRVRVVLLNSLVPLDAKLCPGLIWAPTLAAGRLQKATERFEGGRS